MPQASGHVSKYVLVCIHAGSCASLLPSAIYAYDCSALVKQSACQACVRVCVRCAVQLRHEALSKYGQPRYTSC